MKKLMYMPLSIQMFAEDEGAADNSINFPEDNEIETDINADSQNDEVETSNTSTETNEQPVQTKKDSTKAYSERLNKEREKMRKEFEEQYANEKNAMAKQYGYETWDELKEASDTERLNNLGVTDVEEFKKYLNNAINNDPTMLEARRVIAEQKRIEAEKQLLADVEAIGKLDDSIKSIDDLVNHPSYNGVYEKVQKGMNIVDAFKLENFDALAHKESDAAVQSALNNINNKNHLITTSGGVSSDVEVPKDVYARCREINPHMSDEQIKQYYSDYVGHN